MALPIILASASPRRQDILAQLGIPFSVQASGASEDLAGIPALEAPRILAERKSLEVSQTNPGRWVLGFDTLVYLDQMPLGKPVDHAEARQMLLALRDRWHEVRTGFALSRDGQIIESGQESTRVLFRAFTNHELDDYIAEGESLDKAGSYGIQGQGARFVKAIEGCYYNVVGLPVARAIEALARIAET